MSFDVNYSAGTGGSITPSGTVNYTRTTKVTITATVSDGYRFNTWAGDYVSAGTIGIGDGIYANYRGAQISVWLDDLGLMPDPAIIRANTTPAYYVNLSVNNSSYGTATKSNYSGSGPWGNIPLYDPNSTIVLTATPNSGYSFSHWEVTGGSIVSGTPSSPSITIKISANTEAKAVFSVTTYTVSVSAGTGGTVSGGGAYNYGATCTVTATPSAGYQFSKWQWSAPSGSGELTTNPYQFTIVENSTWTAVFTLNQYTLTLSSNDTNKGTVNPSGTHLYNYGTEVDIFAEAETGYHFDQWTKISGNNPTDFYQELTTVVLTQNTQIRADFSANTYTVTLNQQSGSGGTASVTATYGSAMPSATMPTRAGYTFQGYFGSTGGSGTKYYNTDGSSAHVWDQASAKTIYAYWQAVSVTVNLDASGGEFDPEDTPVTSIVYNSPAGTLVNLPHSPQKVGYNFNGYRNASTAKYIDTDDRLTRTFDYSSETTFYALWIPQQYTAYFTPGSGYWTGTTAQATRSAPYDIETAIDTTDIGTAELAGYDFVNPFWRATATTGNWAKNQALDSQTGHYGNVTFIAQYSAHTYTATFSPNGGHWSDSTTTSKTKSYNINQILTAPSSISRTGYQFVNWAAAASIGNWAQGESLSTLSGKYGNATFSAQWSILSYAVTKAVYPSNGGTISGLPSQANYNSSISATQQATASHSFQKWDVYYNSSSHISTSTALSTTMPAYPIDVRAYYKSKVDVRCEPDGIATVEGGGWVNYNESTTVTAGEPQSGYTFQGWYIGSTLKSTDQSYTYTSVKAPATLTAKFSTNIYALSTEKNSNHPNCTVTGAGQYSYLAAATVSASPTAGYLFDHWEVTGALSTATNANPYTFQMPAGTVNAKAVFAWIMVHNGTTWVRLDDANKKRKTSSGWDSLDVRKYDPTHGWVY